MIDEIRKILQKNANEQALASFRKFVPGAQTAYGVRMPVLNQLAKSFRDGGFPLVLELWMSGSFEERMLAAKVLSHISGKEPERTLELVERFSSDITDWAVCDTLGMQSVNKLRKKFPDHVFKLSEKLVRSKNPWQRRLALVLVEWYTRDASFHPRINKLLERVKDDKEYYVKKAVSWIKRNYKVNR